jgi:peptidoglycan biosynthesis protein MviN/MurJ (putative lipid II flippase)
MAINRALLPLVVYPKKGRPEMKWKALLLAASSLALGVIFVGILIWALEFWLQNIGQVFFVLIVLAWLLLGLYAFWCDLLRRREK